MGTGLLMALATKYYGNDEITCDVVSREHISQILSTSDSVFLACSSCEACTIGSNAANTQLSVNLESRNHCSK